MRGVMTFITHQPPETSIVLSETHIKYLVKAATIVVRYMDKLGEPAMAANSTQIDSLVLEACSLLIIDSLVLPSTVTPESLAVVEYARGLAHVASCLIDAGMNDFDVMDIMHDKWSESHCKDFLRACRTLHTYFKED